jgi:hypothetical protein
MLATKDLNGNFVPMPETPGQKLLRLDDYTVCAVAGLNQRAVAAAPTLNSDILGIIDSYNQQARERASMERTLRNIESIVGFYIENTILVDFATHQPEQRAMDFVDCNMNCLSQLERILKEESSEQVPGR